VTFVHNATWGTRVSTVYTQTEKRPELLRLEKRGTKQNCQLAVRSRRLIVDDEESS
jgi:predicted metalloprotease